MTEMRRVTVSIPENIDRKVQALRQQEEYSRCTYSEIIRRLITQALEQKEVVLK